MFVRTQRLFLRPRWVEDAAELAAAIGHESVVFMLASVPWPYTEEHARAAISRAKDPHETTLLVTLPAEGGRIVGGCGLGRMADTSAETVEVGYWIEPGSWGRGYASEAVCAMVMIAQTLGYRKISGVHALDNPASGRVLAKAGFRATGNTRMFHSVGRGSELEGAEYAIELDRMPAKSVQRSMRDWPDQAMCQAA
jgi:RimJ/RimL family protein N-acetyltransferase